MLIRVTAVLHRVVTLIFHKISAFWALHYKFQTLVLAFSGGWKLAFIRRGRNETRNPSAELKLWKSKPTGLLQPGAARQENLSTQVLLQSAALEAAANAIVITDTEAVIVWANPAFSALTGYSLDEVIGKRPEDLVKSGQQTPEFYRVMWDTIKSGRIWRGEVVNRRKDGTLYTEELTITPVHDEQGRLTHFIAVKENISARKRLEMRQLAQAQLLEKMGSNVSLTELLEEVVRFIETLVPVALFGPAGRRIANNPALRSSDEPSR
jgi:PAS domain S-box-containing protein